MTRRRSPSRRQISSSPSIGRHLIFDLNQCCVCSGVSSICSPGNTEITACQPPAKATACGSVCGDGGCLNMKTVFTGFFVTKKKNFLWLPSKKVTLVIAILQKSVHNKKMVITHACKHCNYNSCVIAMKLFCFFRPRLGFLPVNAACVTTDIIFVRGGAGGGWHRCLSG